MPRVVKSRDEIFSRWGYCDNHDLSRLDNQSIERDRLIGIGFVLNFVKFISFTFGDKEMISVIEAIIREVFVKLLLDSFGKLSIRVSVRMYLLGGAIDGSEANGIIRDPKMELESSRFTFDLVPLSYENVDVVSAYGSWRKQTKEDTRSRRSTKEEELRLCDIFVVFARKDDHGVIEGREDVRDIFQQRGSGAKRKLSRCGRKQMGFESMHGKRKKVIACTSRELKVLMKDCMTNEMLYRGVGRRSEAKNEFEIDVQRSNLGGDYHSSMDVLHLKHGMERNVGYHFVGRNWRELWVVEGLTLERCSTFRKKDKLEPSYVGPFEILGWIGPIVRLKIYVLWAEYRKLDWEFLFDELRVKVRWDSKRGPELTWERKDQMRSRELKRNGNVMVVSFMRILGLREVARTTARIALEFAPDYAFSVSLLLTPLCCDDIHDVTPRVSALAGCDRLVSEPMVIEN
ncbi:hypothetical protein Tco_0654745 [Tanacetum coccineum]|uniref:Uncharacterized protein n=1 Tax=Tanacetum coccineum TaxID=301880 RepID=A0ABQ4X461_9ASTR